MDVPRKVHLPVCNIHLMRGWVCCKAQYYLLAFYDGTAKVFKYLDKGLNPCFINLDT